MGESLSKSITKGANYPMVKRGKLLQQINELLAPLEQQQIAQFNTPRLPVIFVIGAPRCGHTLLSQLLASSGAFCYINNFTARFWLAPFLGAKLSLALGIDTESDGEGFVSNYGRTTGWNDPHEFGNFLRRWIKFSDSHRAERGYLEPSVAANFAREVAAIETIYNRPLMLRNIIYGLNIDVLYSVFPNSVYVVCRRDPLYQAQSILLARISVLGNREEWWSLRPKEYTLLQSSPYDEQIAGQIFYSYKGIKQGMEKIPSGRILKINYSDLCSQPKNEVRRIIEVVEKLSARLDWVLNAIPEKLSSTDIQKVDEQEFNRLSLAIKKYDWSSII